MHLCSCVSACSDGGLDDFDQHCCMRLERNSFCAVHCHGLVSPGKGCSPHSESATQSMDGLAFDEYLWASGRGCDVIVALALSSHYLCFRVCVWLYFVSSPGPLRRSPSSPQELSAVKRDYEARWDCHRFRSESREIVICVVLCRREARRSLSETRWHNSSVHGRPLQSNSIEVLLRRSA